MEKVLILTYYWPPSGGPGVQRWLKFSKYLPEFGFEPFIVTVDPLVATYPVSDASLQDEVPEGVKVFYTSTREPYSIYKKLTGKKQVPYSGFANETKGGILATLSRFIRGNFFVPDARVGWNRFAISRSAELIRQHDIKTIITTSPPHSTQLAGLALKKQFPHLRWIADLRDPWTEIFYYSKMLHLPMIKKKDQGLEKQVLREADVVITVGEFLSKQFFSKSGLDRNNKFAVIANGFDEDDFAGASGVPDPDFFTIAYVGTLSEEYDLTGFIESASQLKSEWEERLRIVFMGSICERWKDKLQARLGEMITFEGHADHQTAICRMQSADLLLLAIPDIDQNKGIVTGKIFEYMASRRPILGVGPPDGDAASLLGSTGCGQLFHYGDHVGITAFLKEMGDGNPRKISPDTIRQYSRKELTRKLTHLIKPVEE